MLPTENPWPAMIFLLTVAVICLVQWTATRRRLDLLLGVICLLLGGGCYALDICVETTRERITQHIYDVTSAFQKQDVQKTLSYFSVQAPERETIESNLGKVKVGDDLRITDISVTFKANNSLAISTFRANATISVDLSPIPGGNLGHHPSRWELNWQREAGEWKIVKVQRLHPLNGKPIGFMAGD